MGNFCDISRHEAEQDVRDAETVPDLSHELDPEYFKYEKRMLEHSGLPFEAFKVHNVVID
jgi:hypothetical protein